MLPVFINRRRYLSLFMGGALTLAGQGKPEDATPPDKDWVCPMDPDYRSDQPGTCPKCGMKLVAGVPDRIEYPLEISQSPERLRAGDTAILTLRALNPQTKANVKQFEIVHEKLIHLFVISENLEFFAHIHPTLQPDGTFQQQVRLPYGGMYRLLADFYPSGSVPQLAVGTIYATGPNPPAHFAPALAPCKSENLTAALRLEPEQPIAGLETKLFFTLDPATEIQPYLGAWAHMLAASTDLIDILHIHPFLADGKSPVMQFNVIFPRTGLYRIWTQFQRENTVNTTIFTVPVNSL